MVFVLLQGLSEQSVAFFELCLGLRITSKTPSLVVPHAQAPSIG
jgi:hypothetical protein